MRKELLICVLCAGMAACSGGRPGAAAEDKQMKKDVVEVLYFHGAQRCATCVAIEKGVRELCETSYAESLKSGKLRFRSVDINKEEALAEKYEVTWSSLILADYDDSGKERAANLTEFAFGTARTAPERFKAGLSERITEMLNN